MKNFKTYLGAIAIFAFLFTSCSKENEGGLLNPDSETTALTFSAIVNDVMSNRAANTKQSVGDLPMCSNDDPAYVQIVLAHNGADVVGNMDEPFRVNLAAGQIFTEEVPQLELPAGMYSLRYFTVHNAAGEVIWIAPQTGSQLGEYVDMTLPMNIDLRAGVKKYVDVPVLCFDNRDVIEYGYQFFELDLNRSIEFCIFGNFCPPSERHYPAEYSVNVWLGDSNAGTALYTNVSNATGTYDNGDFYAEPLCFALPDTDGVDEYYFEITLKSSDEYGAVNERVIRRGSITDDVVRTFFDGENNLDYYHFREGDCDGDDSVPIFEDPENEEMYYKTCAYPMNGSYSIALAYFQIKGDVLKATVLAAGVTPNKQHPQHIHGKDDNSNSTCPPSSADTNGDGLVSIGEGLPYYGGVILPLDYEDGTFPVANSYGLYTYQRTFNISNLSINNWEDLSVVVHGKNVNNEYVASLPVACGEVANLQ